MCSRVSVHVKNAPVCLKCATTAVYTFHKLEEEKSLGWRVSDEYAGIFGETNAIKKWGKMSTLGFFLERAAR